MNGQFKINRTSTTPLRVPRSNRLHTARALTSLPAGKMVPVTAIPLLREDAIRSGRLRFSFEMMETAEILLNAVYVNVMAYLVPTLAFERFSGMDALNRAYEGIPEREGDEGPVPYIETEVFGDYAENDLYVYLGLHGRPEQVVNTGYVEAYNQIWNFRAKNRSPDIELRERLAKDLAPAFWRHEMFRHVVPDFDQAVIDGEVPLNITAGQLSLKKAGVLAERAEVLPKPDEYPQFDGAGVSGVRNLVFKNTAGNPVAYSGSTVGGDVNPINFSRSGLQTDLEGIYAELLEDGITVSLSNIELARKTQSFARLRQQYHGHSDEYIINLLMDGLTIPEQAFKQPMLVGEQTTIFGMSKRYASDSGNLTESVVNGATFLDLNIQLPRISTGGVLMIVAEITPEQLFERQRDAYLHANAVDDLPHFLRDTLDPEKVAVVPCEYVDIDHNTPNHTFGYAPLNYEWNVTAPRIGGRFYRPEVDAAYDEDRQRIWAVETEDPTLSADFYLCTTMHTKPFVVTNQDPFECVTQGDFIIEGNTVFGRALVEASNDWDKVLEKAPMERIDKNAVPEEPEEPEDP